MNVIVDMVLKTTSTILHKTVNLLAITFLRTFIVFCFDFLLFIFCDLIAQIKVGQSGAKNGASSLF